MIDQSRAASATFARPHHVANAVIFHLQVQPFQGLSPLPTGSVSRVSIRSIAYAGWVGMHFALSHRQVKRFREGKTLASDITSKVTEQIEPVVQAAGRLAELHVELLRSELKQAATGASPALASLGAGAGLAAAGGLLGSLALVHGLQRTTRLPLWSCFGLVGGMLGAAGVGLMSAGGRRLSGVSLVPYETLAALKEDLEWVKGTTK